MADSEIEEKIRATIKFSIRLLAIAFFIVAASLFADFTHEGVDPYFWFQRSGAIAVLFSAAAEYWLSQVYADINPPPSSYTADDRWNTRFGNIFKAVSTVALLFLIAGTIIWGYGDIPFKVT